MERIKAFAIAIATLITLSTYAQTDPGRKLAIDKASEQAEKTINAQNKIQPLETAGHIAVRAEIEGTTSFQREFNSYLDLFHDVLSIAAEVYGIYNEVMMTSKHVQQLTEVVADCPANVLATAFSGKKNIVYRNIVKNSLEIINDIRKVCFESSKMTEQDRNKIISGIKPKLRNFNKQLRAMILAIRYTSFIDVYNEVMQRAYRINPQTKHDIITRCRREWWDNAKSVR